ncbi:MAG: DUF1080 domain-containing protein, partial [Planctomycetia bacterium]|nr:DUF1080 domain-containing protein [Planctomycetia bacterium]
CVALSLWGCTAWLAGFVCPVAIVHAAPPDAWQSLFDGRTLAGWEATNNPESFRVEDGAIAAGGGPMAHLVYVGPVGDHDFTDFELVMDVKSRPGSNGGVFFHTEPQTGTLKKGYEAQVCDAYPDKRKTGSLVDVRDIDASPVPDGEWFEYGVSVKGRRITVRVNDTTVVDYEEPPMPERKKGRERRVLSHGQIALQAHDPNSLVFYKNIRIKLPAAREPGGVTTP